MYAQHQTPYILRSGLVSPAEVEKLFKMCVYAVLRRYDARSPAAQIFRLYKPICIITRPRVVHCSKNVLEEPFLVHRR